MLDPPDVNATLNEEDVNLPLHTFLQSTLPIVHPQAIVKSESKSSDSSDSENNSHQGLFQFSSRSTDTDSENQPCTSSQMFLRQSRRGRPCKKGSSMEELKIKRDQEPKGSHQYKVLNNRIASLKYQAKLQREREKLEEDLAMERENYQKNLTELENVKKMVEAMEKMLQERKNNKKKPKE